MHRFSVVASLIRVYFDEETGDTCVDIEFPLETSAFSDEEWFTEPEKKELEGIVLESSHLLDTDVPLFGSTIYGFLRTFDDHPSLNDDEMDRYEALKAEGKCVRRNPAVEACVRVAVPTYC